MFKGLAGASIWSEDLNNLLPFYRDTIGLPLSIESPDFVVLGDLDGATLGLGTHSEVKGRNNDPARHMIVLMTDDVDAEFRRLKGLGVDFVDDPTNFGEVIVATLKDPEGNYVQLLQAV
jgi:predicted enzyme related to lactoylglutathione lyase